MNTKTTPPADFDEAAAAHAKVRATVDALRAEYDAACLDIDATEKELAALPLLTVPFDDMKTAVLDFVETSGKRYADDKIRMSVARFVTGEAGGSSRNADLFGKPLCYCDIEGAISGLDGAMSWAQLFTTTRGEYDDRILYFCFADLVKAALAKVMDEMTPEEFGYGKIHPSKIGTPRAERRAMIESLQSRLEALRAKRGELAGKLGALGHPVAPIIKR
jgi:hypothetical protein